MADLKKYGSAAATGAAAGGAVGGPWGAAIGGGGAVLLTALDDLFGGGGPSTDEAYAEKIRRMEQGAHTYEQYRPQVQQAREQALQQQLSAFNGANNAMGLMYGPQYDPRNYAPTLGVNPYAHGFAPTSGAGPAPQRTMTQSEIEMQNVALGHDEANYYNWGVQPAPGGGQEQSNVPTQEGYWERDRQAAKAAGWWKPNYDKQGNIVSWTNSATGQTSNTLPGSGG